RPTPLLLRQHTGFRVGLHTTALHSHRAYRIAGVYLAGVYSNRRASIGSSRLARHAGYSPNTMPTTAANTMATTAAGIDTTTGQSLPEVMELISRVIPSDAPTPSASPMAPPKQDSTTDSIRN